MSDVSLLAALAAGLLSLLSPCSALLLPSFFAYAFTTRRALLGHTLVFYLGLLLTLVPLGTGAGAVSTLFYGHRALLITVAGWTLIGFGVLQAVGTGFALPLAARLRDAAAGVGGGWPGTLALGATYGLAGFCSGPVLGAILTLTATRSSPWAAGLLLAAYALGMAAPLFVLALLWDRLDLGRRRWLRGRELRLGRWRPHSTSLLSGALFVAVGVLFLRYDGTAGVVGSLGLGDTTDLEFNAQVAVDRWTGGLPSWTLPLVVLVVALAMAARRSWRARRSRR